MLLCDFLDHPIKGVYSAQRAHVKIASQSHLEDTWLVYWLVVIPCPCGKKEREQRYHTFHNVEMTVEYIKSAYAVEI